MKVSIIGGGLSGLIAGKRLAESGFEVKVFESEPELGGLVRSFDAEGFRIPIFYHHVFSHDKVTLSILKELGMKSLVKKKIKMAIATNNSVYSLSYTKVPFWDFLNLGDKARLGLLYLHTKIKKSWPDIEGLSAKEWFDKKVGRNVREKIFENLMLEKYGIGLSEISASELAERISEGEAMGKFLYPKEGFYEMVERLKRDIEKNGGLVLAGTPVSKMEIKNGMANRLSYYKNGNEVSEETDVVVNTAPVPVFLGIAKGLPGEYSKRLGGIKYCANICVDVGYREKLSDFYWINCFNKSFGGIIEHTNLADIYPFKMSWLFKYAPSQELWRMPDENIAKLFVGEARKMFPHLREEWTRVFRCKYASPVYDINYAKFMPSYETPVKNLFFSGVAVTYPKIRTMNTAFASGINVAEMIKKKFL